MPDRTPMSEKEIFLAALDLEEGPARERYLDEACAGDAVLRARIGELLAARMPEMAFPDVAELTRMAGALPERPGPTAGDAIGYFGEYLLLEEIAQGGSGVVFRARQVSLSRVVALKMLRSGPGAADEELARRFKAEAEAAAALDHPNIVPIHEVGVHEGQNYFTMKLVEGGTLSSRLKEYQADRRRAVELMVKVCRAVHHAHRQAILHRDIKPGNILVDGLGEPHVTDFGLARHMEADLDLTVTGTVMGTPHYMSPEQARGESRRLTVATDVYSLGAVIFELMAGCRPFAGNTMVDLLQRVTNDPPPRLRSVWPDSDRDMETIVARCLEKAPNARYGSAAALADDLVHWLRGEPIVARPVSAVERLWKWARRKPALAAAAGVAGLLAVALVVALAVSRHLVGKALEESKESLALSRQSLDRAEGRVSYMTTVLPDLLEPVGRLDLLNGPFENVEQYYATMPAGTRDAAALSRHAAFLSRWSEVLWKLGKRRERLDRLDEAGGLIRTALGRPEAGRAEWLTAATVFRGLSEARAAFNDPAGAAKAAAEAQAAVDRGNSLFPGERLLVVEQARLVLQDIRRKRASGDLEGALALAQREAPGWRALFDGAVAGHSREDRETREAAADFYSEWIEVAREAGRTDMAVLTEFEQRTAAAVQALPDDAGARTTHGGALSYVGNAHLAAGDKARAAEYFRRFWDESQKAAELDSGSLLLKANLHAAEGLYSQVLGWNGDADGSLGMLEASLRGLDAIQARDGALDTFIEGARVNTLSRLASALAARDRKTEACDRVEQTLEARWRRTLARSSEWKEHQALEDIAKKCENWLDDWDGDARILPMFLRLHEAMKRVAPDPGTESCWSWSRAAVLRRMSRERIWKAVTQEDREQAWQWMEESHRRRLAALSQPGAVPEMLRQAHFGIVTWLDHAPADMHGRMAVAAEELAAAIPVALHLGPTALWREDWGRCLDRAAALMSAETASAFCRRVEQGMFGTPCGRDWTEAEREAQNLLKARIRP